MRYLAMLGFFILQGALLAQPTAPPSSETPNNDKLLTEAVSAYLEYRDMASAVAVFDQLVSAGDARAQLWVARFLNEGRFGYPKEPEKAQALAKTVFSQVQTMLDPADLPTKFLLANCMLEGLGANAEAKGLQLIQQLADAGMASAQVNLHSFYRLGAVTDHVHPGFTVRDQTVPEGSPCCVFRANQTHNPLFRQIVLQDVPGQFMGELETLDQTLALEIGQFTGSRQFHGRNQGLKCFGIVIESLFPANVSHGPCLRVATS